MELEKENAGYEELKDYISGDSNKRFIYEGKAEEGFAWAGQVTGLIKDVPTVSELINRMVQEVEAITENG